MTVDLYERPMSRSQYTVQSARSPTPSASRPSSASPYVRQGERLGLKSPRPVSSASSAVTFSASASKKSNIQSIIDRISYTMEDYALWTPVDVRKFILDLSDGCSLLQSQLEGTLYAFSEVTGAKLKTMNVDDVTDLGVSYKLRDLFTEALDMLRENEKKNAVNRAKARRLLKAFLDSDIDNSGTIEQHELVHVVKETFPETSDGVIGVYFRALLRELDAGGLGVVNLTALMNSDHERIMMIVMSEAEKASVVERAFNELDIDKSGNLDRDEVLKLVEVAFPTAGPTLRANYVSMIEREVSNKGQISLDDVLKSDLVHLMLQLPIADIQSGSSASSRCSSVELRCVKTGPRRREPVSRSFYVPHKERLEKNDFFPLCESGQELVDKAEHLLELDPVGSWHEAQEYFQAAAVKFIEHQQHEAAGRAWERSSDCFLKLHREVNAAECLHSAGCAYREISPVDAAQCYKEAAEIYLSLNKPRVAAVEYRSIAETYEFAEDLENAIDWYQIALQTFPEGEKLPQLQCRQKQVALYSTLQLYPESITKCREIIKQVLDDHRFYGHILSMDAARMYQLGLLLTLLATLNGGDGVERLSGLEKVDIELDKYTTMENTKIDRDFAEELVRLVKSSCEVNDFQVHVQKMTAIRDLDPWVASLLVKVRENVSQWNRYSTERVRKEMALQNERTRNLNGLS